ncbi:protein YdiK [Enterobacter cancerogenus]|uniref:Protein YdiK n=1 Tax=Enterobacter cancerogenus TaxID=69218 RepID=A0A484XNL2_9ENTR|nr:protein YdiK [Enterobacter cancerogenus]
MGRIWCARSSTLCRCLILPNSTCFAKFVGVSRATVKGTAVVAVVQGTLGGIAFAIVGIDGSILWGALMAFLSLVPAVGSAIVWVPAAIYLFATHQIWQGLFIVGFFVIIVGLVDNILRPLLVGKDTKMPDYLILISTLGGMELYGINGFVIGPLIAALFIACWNLFSGRDHEGNAERAGCRVYRRRGETRRIYNPIVKTRRPRAAFFFRHKSNVFYNLKERHPTLVAEGLTGANRHNHKLGLRRHGCV